MDRKILIVDDEKNIVDILKFNLEKSGFETVEAYDGAEGVEKAYSESPDLILLDIMLPKMDGFEACKKIREKLSTPIIMLTAREEEVDKILGLELGADDYITKPFSVRELMARIKANLRRMTPSEVAADKTDASSGTIVSGKLTINCDRYEVKKDGTVIDLTLREFELLKFLATQPERIFTRENLLEKVGI